MTPAKWFIRGWQHHLEPLLCLNDIHIRRVDPDWEAKWETKWDERLSAPAAKR